MVGDSVQGQKLIVVVCFCRVSFHKPAAGAGKCIRGPQQQSAVWGRGGGHAASVEGVGGGNDGSP